MKKTYLWGALALVMVTLLGCPTGDDGTPDPISADGPVTPAGWTKGLEDFVIRAGDVPGTVKYKFSATEPAADTYTLHYTEGSKDKAADIKVADKTKSVSPSADFQTITLDPGKAYSVVVVAKSGSLDDAISAVKKVTTKTADTTAVPFKLTVSGSIPNDIVGAAVRENLSANGAVLAVAMKDEDGVFEFYTPTATNPPMPSTTL
ncbi:MAG: hypothetical protein LBG91_00410, partial [Treponema sp.]|nr:hypothetical protein [Treponema sp.]